MNIRNKCVLIIILIFLLLLCSFKYNYFHKVNISAIGDIMAHAALQEHALTEDNGYYCLLESTKKIFLNDDLTIGNLETVVSDDIDVKGFPCFNAKTSYIDAIIDCGIEVLSLANNHSYDQGIKGIEDTIDAVKKRGIIFSGTGYNPVEAKKPVIFRKNGIIFGYLSFTWTTNTIQKNVNEDTPYVYRVAWNDVKSETEVLDIIESTKKKVDVMIISYHAGVEYTNDPHEYKVKFIRTMAETGADVILAHHPHVLQPIEYYKTRDERNTLIAYSLGNFTSAQARYTPALTKKEEWIFDSVLSKTAESVILNFDIVKFYNKTVIVNAGIYPVFNICYSKWINKVSIPGFQTTFIEDVLDNKLDNDDRFKKNLDDLKKLVEYRYNKIQELIKLPVKKVSEL